MMGCVWGELPVLGCVMHSVMCFSYRYGREYPADPYLGHSIGPVAGYGVCNSVNAGNSDKQTDRKNVYLTDE